MLIKRAATLQLTLALKEVPPNGSAWHQLLLQGLPYASLKSAAKELGIKEADLGSHLGLKGRQLTARKRTQRLNASESDLLYAIALAYVRLVSFKGVAEAKAWLLNPAAELKDAKPLDLLRTRLGTEYVSTAIERMRPAPVFSKKVEEEDDEEEDDLA